MRLLSGQVPLLLGPGARNKSVVGCEVSGPLLTRRFLQQRRPIVNLGLVLGPPWLIVQHAHRIAAMLLHSVMHDPRLRGASVGTMGIDQGAHILLVYGSLACYAALNNGSRPREGTSPPYTLLQQGATAASPVLTWGGGAGYIDLRTTNSTRLYTINPAARAVLSVKTGRPFAVLHQWDRAPDVVQRSLLCTFVPMLANESECDAH